ncbi:hypothetical protein [Sphingobacterium siyangense]|uniref:hypothetical protein n=1 Tax=Sphingobacterium siyangense TaxID=459529 RepID=UPI0011C37857|nr:hypothetical protein [Sphingobacterium siyangense]
MPFFTRKPLLETVKGFFRLDTSVFPFTGYCLSSAYRFSQHRTVTLPQLPITAYPIRAYPVTTTVTVLSGNGTPVIADGHAVITVLLCMLHCRSHRSLQNSG